MGAEIRRTFERDAQTFDEVLTIVRTTQGVVAPLMREGVPEYVTIRGERGKATAFSLDQALEDARAGDIEPLTIDWSMHQPPETLELGLQISSGADVQDFRQLDGTVRITVAGPDLGWVLAMHEALRREFARIDSTAAASAAGAAEVARGEAREAHWWTRFRAQVPISAANALFALIGGVVLFGLGLLVGGVGK